MLGVPRDADPKAIKSAYRRLARKHHPDVNPGDDQAEERFKKILAAFRVLSTPKTRRLYNEFGVEGLKSDFDPAHARRTQARRPPNEADDRGDADAIFADIFDGRSPFDTSHMRDFGGFDTSIDQSNIEHGRHIAADLTIDFLTAVTGGPATVRLPHGNVEIDIPEGARNGDILERRGQGGEPSSKTGIPGDLTINLHVKPHRLLRRRGLDLYLDVPITFAEAVKGASIVVPTPRGEFDVSVPSGVHTSTKLRLGGMGVRRSGKVGDFFAVIQVYTPDYVDEEIQDAAELIERGYSEDVRKNLKL
jgi:DnaJ-class molecular chaperone